MTIVSEEVKADYTMDDVIRILLPKFAEFALFSTLQCKLLEQAQTELSEVNRRCQKHGLVLETIDLYINNKKMTRESESTGPLHLQYVTVPLKKPFLYQIGQNA